MHTWQSGAILGFSPSSKKRKRIIKLLVFPRAVLGLSSSEFFYSNYYDFLLAPYSGDCACFSLCTLWYCLNIRSTLLIVVLVFVSVQSCHYE